MNRLGISERWNGKPCARKVGFKGTRLFGSGLRSWIGKTLRKSSIVEALPYCKRGDGMAFVPAKFMQDRHLIDRLVEDKMRLWGIPSDVVGV